MIPLRHQVAIPNVYMAFNPDGALNNATGPDRQASAVLNEVASWSRSLSHLRAAAG